VLVAGVLAIIGALTGVIAVWTLTNLPGVNAGSAIFALAAVIGAVVCAIAGLRSSDGTVDALGAVWHGLWRLSSGIFQILRALHRR
jgi:hypothetical protein